MGLPTIDIIFETKAVSAVKRSEKGVVALILKDDTGAFDTREYKSSTEVLPEDWSERNLDLIKKAFIGNPSKLIVERVDTAAANYNDALNRLKSKLFNYLAVPDESAASDVATWIKGCRKNDSKTYKAVVANHIADDEGVINFATSNIQVEGEAYSAAEYTCRIAGILAGLPYTRSATYYVLPEVEGINEAADPNSEIQAGKLILINDGEKIKIARAVNSLTTTTVEKADEFKKIKILEGMDLIKEDISRTFEDEYIGKVNNSYDNQVLFLTAVNAYLKGLQGEILDPSYNNKVSIDVQSQRLAWEGIGVDVSDLSDQQIKEKSFRSKVFVNGNLKFLDSVEDLKFNISL
ncbi:phage tail sheath C-terminal domain-containing protein [Alkaliphilus peptidifermentans]|uniref:Phage tail sheath protein n=1 Tax=Alkaliphilus peptidifermentans DSM 18978 TaxID=1120976 RepID=A0A1G5JYW4_9FIRM|nr:phage tail sheath C-terminal domain-containing protein [Alkaliphilus peptidifermentans]SCY93060.1 Phage tail sheath protein [Alkaliphilus peptidifermentans DSM 18978]